MSSSQWASTLQELMRRYEGVNSNAWQACAATLALTSGDPTFKDLSFNELQTLFRFGTR